MKTAWTLPLILGLIVGTLIGFGLSGTSFTQTEGSPFLREFALADLTAKAGDGVEWEVLTDTTHDRFPALARSHRVARRIVATATMPGADQAKLAHQVQQATEAVLASHGAVVKGVFDTSSGSTTLVEGKPLRSHVEMPRWFYAIGDIHGVADVGCVAVSGRVTLLVSLIEGS
ncbi:MAG: hypothetical protein VX951_01545 [Planctomycetota bacterium]|nr:hypothetical protein [Planctomycetota bacterium]